jgi:choline dehydrogenase-like flavoprotein
MTPIPEPPRPQPDPIAQGLARGWRVSGPGHRPAPARLHADVAIVGSGAGAGITAELLTRAGLQVVIIEEGPLKSSRDFKQLESDAYPQLYQDGAARKTADKAIQILQGRCVGGSTTVNWTSSFRTPSETLAHWRERFALTELTDEAMAPWFEQAERRLHIEPWPVPPNLNNEVLRRGAKALNVEVGAIRRNVKGCWNLGSCGMGCPTNAKQSMLVTTLPTALDAGAQLLVSTRAMTLDHDGTHVTGLRCAPVRPDGGPAAGPVTTITARHYVIAGGAINGPALMLRSALPDPHARLGRRTFLHPVVISAATFAERIEGWDGAPQTLYSDHHLHTQPIDGPIGFKLEAPPIHPVLFAQTLCGYGRDQAAALARFAHTQALLALLRDGFHEHSPGGIVRLRRDGSPELDYPLHPFVMEGARRAYLAMAELQFAAGAESVTPVHELAGRYTRWAQAREAIEALPMQPLLTRIASAHVMGGCGMAGDERLGVVRPDGVHWQVDNLSVHDGSLFPTSIGANPQLSIYGLVAKLATHLAQRLNGRTVALA